MVSVTARAQLDPLLDQLACLRPDLPLGMKVPSQPDLVSDLPLDQAMPRQEVTLEGL